MHTCCRGKARWRKVFVPYSFADLVPDAWIRLQRSRGSLCPMGRDHGTTQGPSATLLSWCRPGAMHPSLSINHGNSIWWPTAAWNPEGRRLKLVSWARCPFWVGNPSHGQWLWSLSASPILPSLRGRGEIGPLVHFRAHPHLAMLALQEGKGNSLLLWIHPWCKGWRPGWKQSNIHFPQRVILKKKTDLFIFFMSGKWKLKPRYPSMNLWYLKLPWALGKHKALSFGLLSVCLGKLTLWGSIICSDLFWSCCYTACFTGNHIFSHAWCDSTYTGV